MDFATPALRHIGADDLRALLACPARPVLIDVRSADEYSSGHIPGARLVPLPELDSALDEFDTDKEHVFYCHSGIRSLRAAAVASHSRGIHAVNLRGGILAWRGEVTFGLPNLSVFSDVRDVGQGLRRAALLEHVTHALYERLAARFAGSDAGATFRALALAEAGHARHLEAAAGDSSLSADGWQLLESGDQLHDVADRVLAAGEPGRLQSVELALAVEYAALDLYENLAGRSETEAMRQMFSELADTERQHVAAVLSAFSGLPG